MKLEVGMYVRTDKGYISKINWIPSQIWKGDNIVKATIHLDNDITLIYPDDKFKASNSIIDLIELGDYVNGERVQFITNKGQLLSDGGYDILEKYNDISSIVTKEQFENMAYKIEKE